MDKKIFLVFHPFDESTFMGAYSSEEQAWSGVEYWHKKLCKIDQDYKESFYNKTTQIDFKLEDYWYVQPYDLDSCIMEKIKNKQNFLEAVNEAQIEDTSKDVKQLNSDEFVDKYQSKLSKHITQSGEYSFTKFFRQNQFSCKDLETFINIIDRKQVWNTVSKYQKLNLDFVKKYKDKVCFVKLSSNRQLSEEIIRSFPETDWKWKKIALNAPIQNFSEIFLEDYNHKISWNYISERRDLLTREFILKYSDYLNWEKLPSYTKLDMDLIWANIDKLKLRSVSKHQILSDEFIREYSDKLEWFYLSQNLLSDNIVQEFEDKINWDFLSMNKKIKLKSNTLLKYKDRMTFKEDSYKIGKDKEELVYSRKDLNKGNFLKALSS